MKKIFISLMVMFLLFSVPKVCALNSTVEFIPNIYYTLQINDNMWYYNSDVQGYPRIGGDLVYCIEPERLFYVNMNYQVVDENLLALSTEQIKMINLIGHYGYEYYGHQNYRYYLATQELIWNITRPGIDMVWSTEKYAVNFSYFYVDQEKEEILNLVNNHYSKPYFDGESYTINLGEEIILEDDILRQYEIISTNESQVQIIDNKLIIKKGVTSEEEIKLKKKINYDDKEMTFYTSDGSQSAIRARSQDEVISTVKFKTTGGSVSIRKVDSKSNLMTGRGLATLKGTKYNLYNENMELLKEIILNEEIYTITNLPLGIYKLKEIESGTGYLLDDSIYQFEISLDNLNPEIVLKNDIISANLLIKKLYGKLAESNAVFEITNENNIWEIITDKDGKGVINLEYGNYKVKQIKGIEDHYLIEPFDIEIRDNTNIELVLVNDKMKASLQINKTDSETKEIITDESLFKIFCVEENKYITIDGNEILATKNGILKVDNLYFGRYLIEEVKSPNGYLLVPEKLDIDLDEDTIINFENKKDYKKIKIIKEGEDELLDDVLFEVYAKNDIIVNDSVIYQKDELVDSLVTINGQAVTKDIPNNIYYIKEVKTRDEYALDENIYDIDLEIITEITIKNYKKKNNIEENNDDNENSGELDKDNNENNDGKSIDEENNDDNENNEELGKGNNENEGEKSIDEESNDDNENSGELDKDNNENNDGKSIDEENNDDNENNEELGKENNENEGEKSIDEKNNDDNENNEYLDIKNDSKISIEDKRKQKNVKYDLEKKEELFEKNIRNNINISANEENSVIMDKSSKPSVNRQLDSEFQYIKIPDTGVKVIKISRLGMIIILLMGYMIIKYAKG